MSPPKSRQRGPSSTPPSAFEAVGQGLELSPLLPDGTVLLRVRRTFTARALRALPQHLRARFATPTSRSTPTVSEARHDLLYELWLLWDGRKRQGSVTDDLAAALQRDILVAITHATIASRPGDPTGIRDWRCRVYAEMLRGRGAPAESLEALRAQAEDLDRDQLREMLRNFERRHVWRMTKAEVARRWVTLDRMQPRSIAQRDPMMRLWLLTDAIQGPWRQFTAVARMMKSPMDGIPTMTKLMPQHLHPLKNILRMTDALNPPALRTYASVIRAADDARSHQRTKAKRSKRKTRAHHVPKPAPKPSNGYH